MKTAYETSAAAVAAKSLQTCPTLCDPIDGSPPGSPVPGILWDNIKCTNICIIGFPEQERRILENI